MSDHPRDLFGFATLAKGLRDGPAGFLPRLGLSLAAAAASVSAMMLVLGLVEASGSRVRDEQGFLAMFISLALWCGLLIPIWRTYPRWRSTLTTILTCIILIVCTIAAGGLLSMFVRRPDLLIASSSFLGTGATIGVIASAIHRASRGRAIVGPRGQVDVRCPRCAYSLAGLDTTACPECGHRCTIDALILAQGYEGAKRPVPVPDADLPALPAAEAV